MRFSFLLVLPAIIAINVMAPTASQQAQAMNHDHPSFESESEQLARQDASSQTGSGTVQANQSDSESSGLAKYPDKPLGVIPTQPVSLRYVVEHRSALNGKTITVRGIVLRTFWPSTENTTSRDQSMAYPQPRIFLADNLRKRRDKNYDVMVLLREGERGYVVGQTVKIKVMVDASKIAVVMRKLR